MVVCKYFQQGNCRFGSYCKFEHTFGNRSKTFGSDDKNFALLVAEEVLHAEKGGQWLLSCYGPCKEKKCIPGMEDFSPEEVRWEMYQAQKTGTVDQINSQFQQMCEAMRAKQEALKNPTQEIVRMLEEIQNSQSDNVNKGNVAFGQSQQGSMISNQPTNVFSKKTFGTTSSPFGVSNTFNSTQASSSIFGRTTSNTTSVFSGKPSFGSAPMFGGTSTTGSSLFGGANKTATLPFGAVQNTPTFGVLASQGKSIFGNSNQSTFGQSAPFGIDAKQASNAFLKPQTSQVSIFQGPSSVAGSTFGSAAPAVITPLFGGAATSVAPNGASIFGQLNTVAAFGAAPAFGGLGSFGATPAASSIFRRQTSFGAIAPAPSSAGAVFGSGATAGVASFGALAQQSTTTNVFGGSAAATGTNAFEAPPNASPFGAPISTAVSPFGTINAASNPVFISTTASVPGPFGGSMMPTFGFATPATTTTSIFGANPVTTATTNVFGTTPTAPTSTGIFGSSAAVTAPGTTQSPFGGASVFGSSVLASTATNSGTANTTNVFGVKTQQSNASPFGVASVTQSSPFGNFAKSSGGLGFAVTVTIDETAYTPADCLTDDEKAAYHSSQFAEGHIPLKPPSIELK